MILETIKSDWKKLLKDEANKEYFKKLETFLEIEYSNNEVFPPKEDIFNALNLTSFKDTKVVIIGQDPYHGEGQAHGLCFSVLKGNKVPPSLKNIYKEIYSDLGIEAPNHGELTKWAHEGVLLLNTVLTVEKSSPGSHRKKGWEELTNKIILELNEKKENLVFILWGNDAKKKKELLDSKKHLVLESAHPSPFSVRNFQGNKHFSKVNQYLEKNGIKKINWNLG